MSEEVRNKSASYNSVYFKIKKKPGPVHVAAGSVLITLMFPLCLALPFKRFLSLSDWQVGALANKKVCTSGQYTASGECCIQCQPGEGVVRPCGVTQTVCEPCSDSKRRNRLTANKSICMS